MPQRASPAWRPMTWWLVVAASLMPASQVLSAQTGLEGCCSPRAQGHLKARQGVEAVKELRKLVALESIHRHAQWRLAFRRHTYQAQRAQMMEQWLNRLAASREQVLDAAIQEARTVSEPAHAHHASSPAN